MELFNDIKGEIERLRKDTVERSKLRPPLLSRPIAIMLSKADMLSKASQSSNKPFKSDLADDPDFLKIDMLNKDAKTKQPHDKSINLQHVKQINRKVEKLLKNSGQGGLKDAVNSFKRKSFFAVSATGISPDENGNFTHVRPWRCLDPVLWILHELGMR